MGPVINQRKHMGFSLIELVIVVVIIGIIGAIAIPRMSRGSSGAADAALSANLAVLRNAIDLYQTEHGGTYPSEPNIVSQLTMYTNDAGGTSATKTGAFVYGPYLRKVPPLPVGSIRKGEADITNDPTDATTGWVYNGTTGVITPNTAPGDTDTNGVAYSTY